MGKFNPKDHFFRKAKKDNYLARSAYKLEEVDKKHKVLRNFRSVLDVGYHPGSWTQFIARNSKGKLIIRGIDLKEINLKLASQLKSQHDVVLYQKDFLELKDISELEMDERFDLVVSDMAPDTTGIKSVDQARSHELVDTLLEWLPIALKSGGNFVCKVFEGPDFGELKKKAHNSFKSTALLRPEATRKTSKEIFLIGKGFN